MKTVKKSWIIIAVVLIVAAAVGIWSATRPEATVEVIRPTIQTITAYVEEQAVTELPHDYLISMPISGWLEPITLREGDPVKKDQVAARLDTDDLKDHALQAQQRIAVLETKIRQTKDHRLENNAMVETKATVKAIDETVKAAEAKLVASLAVAQFAKSEAQRVRKIAEQDAATARELRLAETDARKSEADYQSDKLQLAALKTIAAVSYIGPKFISDYIARKDFDVESLERQLEEARAQLDMEKRNLARAEIKSPVDGVVLQRHQTRRQFLPAGTPLLTIGRLDDMEVIADVLTQRATRISPGDPVEIFGEAIGTESIPGKVLRVYPAGFKKISSLGVEQQRVKVAVKMDKRPERLGVDFRVYVRINYARAKDAMTLPRTALFRSEQGQWQVMTVRNDRTSLATVKVGLTNDDLAQILDGLKANDIVVARPSREITAGMHVATQK
ncbi:MAG: efflux RND transporter periplasmic adaptor subunit [Phycisphaerae bacterium]|nr:efflux RND transporter periplasmic adaptor subunit [Phycisphaerae bacterium]